MSRADFDRFVQRKQEEKAQSDSFDPKQQLADWLERLDALYTEIGNFLTPYIDAGKARTEFRPIQMNEEFSGPYEARQMFLSIGTSTIIFKPVGTMLIGSKGRVDVQGPRGSARLGLINRTVTHARQLIQVRVSLPGDRPHAPEPSSEEIEWEWKIITPAPEMKFIEFNEDNFFDMLLSVADA